jgi:two-component system, NtrC family, response regulator
MILIVDDEQMIRDLLKNLLKRSGYEEVYTAANARDAIKFLNQNQFIVALVDIGIPDLDGLELIRQHRGVENFAQFIVITGDGSLSRRMEAFEVGAYGFLTKPFSNLGEVKAMVERCHAHVDHWRSVLFGRNHETQGARAIQGL